MSTLITFLHVLVCLILVGTVLLQQGKGGGMGGAFGGANAATVFGSGGASTFLRRLTAVAATVFMLTSMVLAYIASNDAGDALKSYSAQQTQLKKRKKDAETRALDGVTGDAGVPEAGGGTGPGIDDGDTGEDEGGADGIAPTPVEPAAIPAPGGDDVTGAEVPAVIEDEPAVPAPTPAPVEKPAAKPATPAADKPAAAPATPAGKPAAKPAADKPAAKPAADKPAAKPAVKPTDKPSTTPVEPAPAPTPAVAPTTPPTN